jgi:hypothetical protein
MFPIAQLDELYVCSSGSLRVLKIKRLFELPTFCIPTPRRLSSNNGYRPNYFPHLNKELMDEPEQINELSEIVYNVQPKLLYTSSTLAYLTLDYLKCEKKKPVSLNIQFFLKKKLQYKNFYFCNNIELIKNFKFNINYVIFFSIKNSKNFVTRLKRKDFIVDFEQKFKTLIPYNKNKILLFFLLNLCSFDFFFFFR